MFQFNSKNTRTKNPVGIYMFKVNNRNTRTRCEMCSELTKKTPERREEILNGKLHFLCCDRVEICGMKKILGEVCCNQ